MGFRKSVLDFIASQLEINNARHGIAAAHQREMAAMSRQINALERRVAVLERGRR